MTLASTATTYIGATTYYDLGYVYQQTLGNNGKRIRQTNTVDDGTGRLQTARTETENPATPGAWIERLTQNYGYDHAGNVRAVTETNAGSTTSNQCLNYDGLRQLTQAWTTTSSICQANPTTAVVGGPDPYWTSYSYDNATGNRTTEVRHALTGTDTTRSYAYPTTGQRHTLTTVANSGGVTGTDSYTYDSTGNTKTRNITGKPGQTLTWDSENRLASVSESSGTTTYIYDADGNRLVGKDPSGTTVYLPGFELRKIGTATTCTRYVGSATRTATAVNWVISDAQGTGQLAIDAVTLTTTRRKTDPFGNPRGSDPAWPNQHGFINGIRDNTGLTHLGAREYEPATGRFISADPVTSVGDPQQLGGYSYAANNPATNADPSGLHLPDCNGTFNQCGAHPTEPAPPMDSPAPPKQPVGTPTPTPSPQPGGGSGGSGGGKPTPSPSEGLTGLCPSPTRRVVVGAARGGAPVVG